MFFSARVNKSGLFRTQPLTFSSRWGCVGVRNQQWWQHQALLTRTPPSAQGSQLLVQQYHSCACILATMPVKQLTTFVSVGSAVTCWYSNQSRLLHRHQTRAVGGLFLSLRRLFFVILAPQTSAAQSWQSVCPQQALPPYTSSNANRKLHLLPASLVSTLPVWNRQLPRLAPHPTPSLQAVTLHSTFGGRASG